ncbi:IclR family transcriptional regulator [Frankia sp. CcI49]|uniref:IclR family transcriptional regulator n=1 Tax=unclassified Frankia TaxID=2632575 RepID=UPI0006C9ECDC|nr:MULTISPECIES: IclR family transcriptional regulator [unclassified Frankia]KPM50596.1 IclR family transcriptional regulator [Frankia sp. R43]ONH50288.1 IclR family transcriptional regulator [Frankia sp. CcI49]
MTVDDERLVGADRVLAVLKELARHPDGVTLDEVTRAIESAKPTVHRALASLRRAGLASQDSRGRYLLGDELLRMAFTYHEARPDHVRIRPVLDTLAERFGETVHYAVLDGREVVYRAKVDPPTGAIRLTSTIGGRNPAHATGVGKLLLAYELTSLTAIRSWIGGAPLPRKTSNTLCTAEALHRELDLTRERGYAVDDEENEMGVTCIALPVVELSETKPPGGVSVSALAYRTPLATLVSRVGEIRDVLAAPGAKS